MNYKFGVIGLGKVGRAMTSILADAGHTPLWAVTRQDVKVEYETHRALPPAPRVPEVVFLAVPDGRIATAAAQMATKWGNACRNLVVFHFSGMHCAEILHPLSDRGAECASLHPLQTIMNPENAGVALKESCFTTEGSDRAMDVARDLVKSIGSGVDRIRPEDKMIYHTAAVMVSNYMVTILTQATEMISDIGLDMERFLPLVRNTIRNVEAYGRYALTGPIQRGDWETVSAHIDGLCQAYPDIVETYTTLGRYTARMAGQTWPAGLGDCGGVKGSSELAEMVKIMQSRGQKVVFTNGCFDILHHGHVAYLNDARNLGDCLIVGLNSDASVRKLEKGPDRPINPQQSRAAVLSGLRAVDYVCIFDQETPYELISLLRPDVLVKGGDWAVDDIVGSDVVRSYGGQVRSLQFREGLSTTAVIEKIRKS